MAREPQTVLVIDDEADLLELVELILSAEGLRVVTAHNGLEGLVVADRERPDLILLDLKMPVMNGPGFAAAFHARHGHATPILVLSAADDPRRRASVVGAAGWLNKPFDVDQLVAVVHGLLAPRSAPASGPAGP